MTQTRMTVSLPDPRTLCYPRAVIVGVSGLNGAGKGEVVHFLEAAGFDSCSLSDVIRRDLSERGLEETRERMIEAGNAIRGALGPGGLAEKMLPQLDGEGRFVVDSIRHPAEVEVLRRHDEGFRLLWVECDEAIRLPRMRDRGRPGDPETLEQLRVLEGRELESDDPRAQQLLAVRAMADAVVLNDSTLEALHAGIRSDFARLGRLEALGSAS
ncbi:AAA family ATPase [Myxococcota bacterium]|nr:AAA family ATPase [Myxococcota bacterium]